MSTEICINYSDEISRNTTFLKEDENYSYSSMGVLERANFNKALSGNVKSEYEFAVYLKDYGKGKISSSLGDMETLKKEAMLDHSAKAQVPEALVHGAFVNLFGGLATVENRKKAINYASKACLQGNYDAVGCFFNILTYFQHPLQVVYHLEFLINSRARSLFESFLRAGRNINYEENNLSSGEYAYFCEYAQSTLESHVKQRLFFKCKRGLIIKMAGMFNLGCSIKIRNGETPNDGDSKEFLHFIKCLSILDDIRRVTERRMNYGLLAGNLNHLLKEISENTDVSASNQDVFDKGIEIVITRLFLENYSQLSKQKDIEALKELADKTVCALENDCEAHPNRCSAYVLRLLGLYELYIRNGEIRHELEQALDKCTEPEFYRIARELDFEKLLVASLSDSSKKYNGKTVWSNDNNEFSYNRDNFAGYLSDGYRELVSCLVRLCDCVNMQSKFPVIYKHCHEDCFLFIRSYMALDPVLAYNDCDYSLKLSAFIKYAVDKLSLSPQELDGIKKAVPFYGYTPTSAAGLYLLESSCSVNSEGSHWEEISRLNEPEQQIAILRQQIAQQDLNNIVIAFSLQKDNPSENYDYLLKEFLHKLCCFDLALYEKEEKAKGLFSFSIRLLNLLFTRAKTQYKSEKGGIASECLYDLSKLGHIRSFFKELAIRLSAHEEYKTLKGRLDELKPPKTYKYPSCIGENMIIGDCRDYGRFALSEVNSHFKLIKRFMRDGEPSERDFCIVKSQLIKYHRTLLAYSLCNPLRQNRVNFEGFEHGDISYLVNKIYPDYEDLSDEQEDEDNYPVRIPHMKVHDSDPRHGKDSARKSASDSTRSKEKMKELDFEKDNDKERETADKENTASKHYELKNADKPLHIIGNRKLSEILNDKVIKALKTDPVKMKKYGFNIAPNFILFGEPGCGKTEAVRQYCEHLGLEPVIINSATVGTSHIHETPVNILNKFDEAISKKNGVIIIDEADAFLSERDNLRTDDDFKTEEVSAALQGVDLANRNHTQVIAMTNNLEKIDKAILRDGRLGIHIEVKNPDESDLEEIIEHYFEKGELKTLNKTEMAKVLNGQSIASVFSIFNGIRMDVVMNDVELTHQYVMHKINASLGYTLEEGAYFSLPGQKEFEDYVNKNIVEHLLNPDWYRKYNLKFPNSILLYGPTGTGKTYAAKKLAEFLDWTFIKLDSKSIGSEAVQGSAIKIAKVFDRARREAPCIIFIDEIDAWLPKRSGRSTSSEIGQVNEFLANMSQVNSDNLLLIGTTNRIDDIDEAALRNGRFSTKIEIGYMKGEQVEELLHSLIKDIPYDDSIDLSEIAKTQDNKSVADIVAFFEKACRFSAENKYDFLTEECFQKAMDTETKQDENRRIGFL